MTIYMCAVILPTPGHSRALVLRLAVSAARSAASMPESHASHAQSGTFVHERRGTYS